MESEGQGGIGGKILSQDGLNPEAALGEQEQHSQEAPQDEGQMSGLGFGFLGCAHVEIIHCKLIAS